MQVLKNEIESFTRAVNTLNYLVISLAPNNEFFKWVRLEFSTNLKEFTIQAKAKIGQKLRNPIFLIVWS